MWIVKAKQKKPNLYLLGCMQFLFRDWCCLRPPIFSLLLLESMSSHSGRILGQINNTFIINKEENKKENKLCMIIWVHKTIKHLEPQWSKKMVMRWSLVKNYDERLLQNLKKSRKHTWTMATSSSLAMRFGSPRSPVAPGTTSSGGTSVIFGEASLGDTVYDVWLDL